MKWFFKKTVTLDNATETVAGDDVGVLTPWKPPGLMDNVEIGQIGYVLDGSIAACSTRTAIATGQLYGPTTKSKENFAGKVIERVARGHRGQGQGNDQGLDRERRARRGRLR